jgi:hypothetical protein
MCIEVVSQAYFFLREWRDQETDLHTCELSFDIHLCSWAITSVGRIHTSD